MSYPFIIWTMQRTGGTTLASLLMALSEHPATQHEPFNRGRKLNWIWEAWTASGSEDELRENIRNALKDRMTIKHCYELVPEPINRILSEVSTELGYHHLILDRNSEIDRIISLALAELTGAWGKKDAQEIYQDIENGTTSLPEIDISSTLEHLRNCHRRRKEVAKLLGNSKDKTAVVFFEDFYTDPEAGTRKVRAVIDFLNIERGDVKEYDKSVWNALKQNGQNSSRVINYIPNLSELRAALETETSNLVFSWN